MTTGRIGSPNRVAGRCANSPGRGRTLLRGNDMDERTCSRCEARKSTAEFHRDSSRHDGLHPWCKACRKSAGKQHRQAHPEYHKVRQRRYVAANPDFMRDAQARYRSANREALNARSRAAYWSNPGRAKSFTADWKRRNPEAIREQSRRRRARVRSAKIAQICASCNVRKGAMWPLSKEALPSQSSQ